MVLSCKDGKGKRSTYSCATNKNCVKCPHGQKNSNNGSKTRNKCQIFNDVRNLASLKAPKDSLKEFVKFVETVTDCLWELDCNHGKFITTAANGHCKTLPNFFSAIFDKEYKEWKRQKKPKPRLDRESLYRVSDKLFDQLSYLGDSKKKINQPFFEACHQLAVSIRSYADSLEEALDRYEVSKEQTVEEISDFFHLPREAIPQEALNPIYAPVNNLISGEELYSPVFLEGDFIPSDRKARYKYFQDMKVCFR